MARNLERVTKWAPIVGRWEVSDSVIAYLGPQQAQLPVPIGICISNIHFSQGEVKAFVHLPENLPALTMKRLAGSSLATGRWSSHI